MDWGKKVKVPLEFTTFAASYRYGYKEFLTGRNQPRQSGYFTQPGAYEAYQAGWALAKAEAEKEGAA